MFIGDSVPVKGDIPIFFDEREMRKTLRILRETRDVEKRKNYRKSPCVRYCLLRSVIL